MYDTCDRSKHRKTCRIAAKIYYAGVRIMGRELVDESPDAMTNSTSTTATTTNDTTIAIAVGANTDAEIGREERGGNWFADWVAHLSMHPELLKEMTERELDNVGLAVDAGLEEMEKE
jgi:hypothetical protein